MTTADLANARVVSDARFDSPEMGSVFANRAVRAADGRLVLADDRGQVYVVYRDRPEKILKSSARQRCVRSTSSRITPLGQHATRPSASVL